MLKTIARGIIDRAVALNLKGKKRDDMALDYWVGAARAAEALGHEEEAAHLRTVAVMLIATRGYSEVERIVANG